MSEFTREILGRPAGEGPSSTALEATGGWSKSSCGDTTSGVPNCAKCTAPTTTGQKPACSECSNNKIVKTAAGATSCIDESACNNGFFVETTASGSTSSKVCTACTDDNCDVCAASGAKKCSKCKTSGDKIYLQKEADSQTGTCIDANGCTNGNTYYADDTVDPTSGKLCRKCAEGGVTVCTKCEKIESGVVCKECTGETAIFGLNKKSCVAKCPNNASEKSGVCTCNDGFTPNEDSSACVAASGCKTPHCRTCTGEGQENEVCTECVTSYYRTPTGQCVDSCEKLGGYYADSNVCKSCDSSCASCSTAGNNKCLSCPAGKALKYTDETSISGGGSCVGECKTGANGCADCGATIGGSKYCSRCSTSSEYPVNGVCKASTARANECKAPDNKGGCSVCASGYFLLDNGCYKTDRQPGSQVCKTEGSGKCTKCANEQTPDQQGSCPTCPAGCSKCSDANTCTECLAGYYKTSANTCVKCSENSADGNIKGVPNCVSCAAPTTSGTVTCYVTQTPAVDPADPSTNKGGLSSGAIAGISVAVIAVVGGLVGFLCWWFVCRGKA
ncbi:Variant-specific surface protein [Giardia duodenalis]|uniref:Variant-specific surface protein n=1 Tax=Giardia intestinalis TaxID=5741 RepID=V6TNN1_GIAIN|nr:Variant-specific surface protein [Giardia intestinalis]